MAGEGTQPGAGAQSTPEAPKNEKVSEGGLAAGARAILDGVFQTFVHSEWMEKNVELINKVTNEVGTAIDKSILLKTIRQQLGQTEQSFGDSAGYADNFYSRLEDQVSKVKTLPDPVVAQSAVSAPESKPQTT